MEEMKIFFEGIRQQESLRGIFMQMDEDIKEFVKASDETVEKLKSYENI